MVMSKACSICAAAVAGLQTCRVKLCDEFNMHDPLMLCSLCCRLNRWWRKANRCNEPLLKGVLVSEFRRHCGFRLPCYPGLLSKAFTSLLNKLGTKRLRQQQQLEHQCHN